MKKQYVRPTAVIETFSANEYVAACEKDPETGEVLYNFTCDAGNPKYGQVYRVFLADGTEITNTNGQVKYAPCGKTHTTTNPAEFPKGHIEYYNNPGPYDEDVIIWRGKNNNEVHCAKALSTVSGVAPANFEPTRS